MYSFCLMIQVHTWPLDPLSLSFQTISWKSIRPYIFITLLLFGYHSVWLHLQSLCRILCKYLTARHRLVSGSSPFHLINKWIHQLFNIEIRAMCAAYDVWVLTVVRHALSLVFSRHCTLILFTISLSIFARGLAILFGCFLFTFGWILKNAWPPCAA